MPKCPAVAGLGGLPQLMFNHFSMRSFLGKLKSGKTFYISSMH